MIKKNIKKIIKSVFSCFMLSYFLAIMVILLPKTLTMPSISFRSAIITAIGLDKSDDNIDLSVLTISDISNKPKTETTKVISSTGETLAKAVSNLEVQIGRNLRMGHVGYIVISKDFFNEDIANVLNNLIITTKLPNTVSLVFSGDKSKEVLKKANTLENTSSFKLREIIQNEYSENFTKDTSIDSFLKGYYSNISVSTIGYITLEENMEEGIDSNTKNVSSNSGDEQNQTTQKNTGSKKATISFKKENAVFVDGKFKYIINTKDVKGLFWIVESDLKQFLTIDNITTQGLKNAKVSFETNYQNIDINSYFRNDIPIIEYNIDIGLDLVEIISQETTKHSPQDIVMDEVFYDEINNEVKKQISAIINNVRKEKADVVNAYRVLYSHNYNKFIKFLDNLKDGNDFLSYIQFKIIVNPKFISS